MDTADYREVYSKLALPERHIRLLTVQEPGWSFSSLFNFFAQPPEEIQCSLHVVSLDNLPAYSALSYTWGGQPFDHRVIVNGKALLVTKSCHDALQAYRNEWFNAHVLEFDKASRARLDQFRKQAKRVLWVDQLCIDQTDQVEKGRQISLMKVIYAGAAVVWNWTGPWKNESFVDFINEHEAVPQSIKDTLPAASFESVELIDYLCQHWVDSRDRAVNLFQPGPSIDTVSMWLGVLGFLSHAYFSRRWIVQELGLNETIFMLKGNFLIDVKVLESVFLALVIRELPIRRTSGVLGLLPWDVYRRIYSPVIQTLYFFRPKLTAKHENGYFVYLLHDFRVTITSNAHDRLYALLSLAPDQSALPAPNYDCSPETMCVDYASALIRAGFLAQVLQTAGTPFESRSGEPSSPADIPSWCPNWLDPSFRLPWTTHSVDQMFWDEATNTDGVRFSLNPHDREVLHVRAVEVDRVAHCHRQAEISATSWTELCRLVLVGQTTHQRQPPTTMPSHINRLLLRMYQASFAPNADPSIPPFANEAEALSFKRPVDDEILPMIFALSTFLQYPHPQAAVFAQMVSAFWQSAYARIAAQYTFVITIQGRLGLSAGPAKPGDVVMFVEGCWLPLVFRRRNPPAAAAADATAPADDDIDDGDGPGTHFQLIGDSAILGHPGAIFDADGLKQATGPIAFPSENAREIAIV